MSNGALENYLPSFQGNQNRIPKKDKSKIKAFEDEYEFLLDQDLNEDQLKARYGDLITLLDEVAPFSAIDLELALNPVIGSWINEVQMAFQYDQVRDQSTLENNARVNWAAHSRIFVLLEFSPTPEGFTCKIQLKPSVDPRER